MCFLCVQSMWLYLVAGNLKCWGVGSRKFPGRLGISAEVFFQLRHQHFKWPATKVLQVSGMLPTRSLYYIHSRSRWEWLAMFVEMKIRILIDP